MSLPNRSNTERSARPRTLCAVSGGVDSSVAASLLLEAGHEVIAVFLRNGVKGEPGPGAKGSCCSASDARDASRVADRLGIPFYALDYSTEFGDLIDAFRSEYRKGRTPSPCVLCNQDLKFGHLFQLADDLGCERIATGHYARCDGEALYRPIDSGKDQTYFLFGIEPDLIPRLSFPLGELTKEEVRELARARGFANADKAESMEICFVPTGDYRDLLREQGPLSSGAFVNRAGERLGEHQGFEAFTVGQRRGLPALGTPHYVLEVRPESREVVLGTREQLACASFQASGLRWLAADRKPAGRVLCQVRARHEASPAQIERRGEDAVSVRFDDPQEAICPGQAAVFYDGDRVLGGAWIESQA